MRASAGRAFLDVSGLRVGGLRDISFRVREGEILGIAGLLGSGRSTLLEGLFGAHRLAGGRVGLAGAPLDLRTPARAMAAGVALVPEQRSRAVFGDRSLAENLNLAEVDRFWTGRRMDRRAERRAATADVDEYGIVAASPDAAMATLSGGNQQKVVLARWMRQAPCLLLLDEPTLGVDVGARAEIHAMIRRYVSGPRAAICVSSDVEELCALADRILVLRAGVVAHEIEAGEATPDTVNQLVHQGAAA
jgi:ribose transport system ATP-binding protein